MPLDRLTLRFSRPMLRALTANMNRRRFLIATTFTTFIVGVVLASIPFFGSLRPNARAEAALPRFNISGIGAGDLYVMENPIFGGNYNGYEFKLLFYKDSFGQIKVWVVPVKDGLVGMPDIHWWRPIHQCQKFEVVTEGTEKVLACLDKDISDWWSKQWKWTIKGENIEGMVDDLESAKGVIEDKYFVYAKGS